MTIRLATLALSVFLLVGGSVHATAKQDGPVARTSAGLVRGTDDGPVRRFEGIPYAAAPVGALRWAAPAPPTPWSGVRDARRPGAICQQPAEGNPPGTAINEDCLFLNVTAPARAHRLPVLVWIHGGGFIGGSGSEYGITRPATVGNMVVVTINYRLGIFGTFPHPRLGNSGAFGLQDQQAALRWVRHNAAAFGGDPRNVTVAGESAGGMSICSQLTSPSAVGLFDRAIIASGSCAMTHPRNAFAPGSAPVGTWQPVDKLRPAVADAGARLGCPDPRTALSCLRDKRPEAVMKENGPLFQFVTYGTDVLPIEPAVALREGWHLRVPVMQGNTRDEHARIVVDGYTDQPMDDRRYKELLVSSFGIDKGGKAHEAYPLKAFTTPLSALNRVFTDNDWICPSVTSNRHYARFRPTYGFVFDDPTAPIMDGGAPLPPSVTPATVHGSDVPYTFDWPTATPSQRRLSDHMIRYWANFARTGDPNGPGLSYWPPVTAGRGTRAQLLAPDAIRPIDMNTSHHCDLWSP
ncbi:para-nitrobenzyl esterase [Herbihabitans rhizosphaerae]|uniref:Carboxylic ester hydrolase n=1 Tax=Herbihabitans rhizosphaerae TaxID=1872711 RepID=A0A4Q7KDG7_9PSEU|nr:carboxylesterase family protein [Herbihabitans rhizosphaerae]RZS32254.1 para-nitrobenzyl esterase [Herbihabitans rhizosphaerae]